jgi:hypothetical protein
MRNPPRYSWSTASIAFLLGAITLPAAHAAFAVSAPTEWCGVSATQGIVYFDYCGFSAPWHFDRFDLATNQWLAPISMTSHTSFAVGAPGLLVASYDGVVRYELDGSNPSALPGALSGASNIALDGPFLFLGNYGNIQSYDLIAQHAVNLSNNGFGYSNPNPFIVDSAHGQLLGLTGAVAPESPSQLSYDVNGVLQDAPVINRYALPFAPGKRNYLAPDAATFANSGGAIFTTDSNLSEVAWLGGPFDDLVYTGSEIVVLRYDTLVRIDRTTHVELGRLTLDHTCSDLVLDGTDRAADIAASDKPQRTLVPGIEDPAGFVGDYLPAGRKRQGHSSLQPARRHLPAFHRLA